MSNNQHPNPAADDLDHCIVCNNLTITTSSTVTSKPIALLRSFTAKFIPGRLVGLLGPSGCGKTSLLECLHSCTPTSSHQLFYNSQPLSPTLARTHFAYLPQEDVLPSYMTVSEYLLFCAQLYEPSLTSVMCVNGVAYLLQRLDLVEVVVAVKCQAMHQHLIPLKVVLATVLIKKTTSQKLNMVLVNRHFQHLRQQIYYRVVKNLKSVS